MHGLQLAKELHAIDENIGVVFVMAFSQFALEAFAVDSIGYSLKPYTPEEMRGELRKVARYMPTAGQRIRITTIPLFSIRVDGKKIRIPSNKCRELLAFFVDRAGIAVSSGEIVSCLWPERANDEATIALLRVTYNRLLHLLEDAGIFWCHKTVDAGWCAKVWIVTFIVFWRTNRRTEKTTRANTCGNTHGRNLPMHA